MRSDSVSTTTHECTLLTWENAWTSFFVLVLSGHVGFVRWKWLFWHNVSRLCYKTNGKHRSAQYWVMDARRRFLSTQDARISTIVSCISYNPLVLGNLPRASWLNGGRCGVYHLLIIVHLRKRKWHVSAKIWTLCSCHPRIKFISPRHLVISSSYYRTFSIPVDAVNRRKLRTCLLIRFGFHISLKASLETIIPLVLFSYLAKQLTVKKFLFDSTSFIMEWISSPTQELYYIQWHIRISTWLQLRVC